MTLNENIIAGFNKAILLLKQVRDNLDGKIGGLSSLNTSDKTSLVAALNSLKSQVDALTQINDAATSTTQTWSSQKISTAITAAITQLVSGADSAKDTLKELADLITAQVQSLQLTDAGLVNTKAAQTFTAAEKAQARRNIGAVAADDIGDITTADFAGAVTTAFNAA